MSVSISSQILLSDQQLYELFRGEEIPQKISECMGAIALRESGGNPSVVNNTPETGDMSYGLMQINMANPQVREDIIKAGLVTEEDFSPLLDPAVNAKAAKVLWGGNNSNLNIAWYIQKGGSYQTRYEANLPRMKAAALKSAL